MRKTLTALLALAVIAAPASADPAADVTKRAESAIEYFDKYRKEAKNDISYANLVYEMAEIVHPLTVKRVGKILLKDRNVEHQMIAADALKQFRYDERKAKRADAAVQQLHKDAHKAAGDALVKRLLTKKEAEVQVKDSCVLTLGKLPFPEGIPAIGQTMLKGQDPWMVISCVRALGWIGDKHGLPYLLELWDRNPTGYSWPGGEVTVDTGAAGDADQKAAEAAYKAKYGGMKKAGGSSSMFKVYVQELKRSSSRIIGEKIETTKDLRDWMESHVEELRALGVDVPKYKGRRRATDEEIKEQEEKDKKKKKKGKKKGKKKKKGDDK